MFANLMGFGCPCGGASTTATIDLDLSSCGPTSTTFTAILPDGSTATGGVTALTAGVANAFTATQLGDYSFTFAATSTSHSATVSATVSAFGTTVTASAYLSPTSYTASVYWGCRRGG